MLKSAKHLVAFMAAIISLVYWILSLLLAIPGGKKYAILKSLDLICDSPEEQQIWYRMVSMYMCTCNSIKAAKCLLSM